MIFQRNSGGLVPKVGPLDTAEPMGSALAGACEGLHNHLIFSLLDNSVIIKTKRKDRL